MRRFLINVNGKSYDVAVEEIDASFAPQVAVSQPVPVVPTPAPTAVSVPVPEPKSMSAPVSSVIPEGTKIEAPMPGNIVEVKVTVGDEVKEGDPVIILEAMKLENELLAPCSGKVLSINAAKGDIVNTGDVLGVIG